MTEDTETRSTSNFVIKGLEKLRLSDKKRDLVEKRKVLNSESFHCNFFLSVTRFGCSGDSV